MNYKLQVKKKRWKFIESFSKFIACIEDIKIDSALEDFKSEKEGNFMFHFISCYLEMLSHIFDFIYASRARDWNLHLSSLQKMMPAIMMMDRVKYRRWIPVYLADMIELKNSDVEFWNYLKEGNFSVQNSQVTFVATGQDHVGEQENRIQKIQGGLQGIIKRANVQTCKRANVQTCKRANVQTCKRANVQTSNAQTHKRTNAQTHKRTNAQTHKRTNAQTHKRTNAQTHKRTNAQTHKRTNAQTHKRTNAQTHKRTNAQTHKRTNAQTHKRTNAQTHKRTNAQTHKRTNAQTHKRTNAQTHKRTNAQTHKRTNAQTHKRTNI